MGSHCVDRDYVREIELTMASGRWNKDFKRTLSNFRHLNSRDTAEIKIVKSQAALKACKALKQELYKFRI